MSAKFSLDDYVDVAERIREFSAKYPDGSLQGEGEFVTEPVVGYLYRAAAYRNPDDPRPGIGTAFEPIPGKTPYTRDSEVQNAETAAWGRAIVALGFETKKIASKQEVKGRASGSQTSSDRRASPVGGKTPADGTGSPEPDLQRYLTEIDTVIDALALAKGNDKAEWIKAVDEQDGTGWRGDATAAALVLAKVKRWAGTAGVGAAA